MYLARRHPAEQSGAQTLVFLTCLIITLLLFMDLTAIHIAHEHDTHGADNGCLICECLQVLQGNFLKLTGPGICAVLFINLLPQQKFLIRWPVSRPPSRLTPIILKVRLNN